MWQTVQLSVDKQPLEPARMSPCGIRQACSQSISQSIKLKSMIPPQERGQGLVLMSEIPCWAWGGSLPVLLGTGEREKGAGVRVSESKNVSFLQYTVADLWWRQLEGLLGGNVAGRVCPAHPKVLQRFWGLLPHGSTCAMGRSHVDTSTVHPKKERG